MKRNEITLSEAVALSGKNRQYLYKMVQAKKFDARLHVENNGAVWKIDAASFDAWINRPKSSNEPTKFIVKGEQSRVLEAAKMFPDLAFYKAPTHAHPEKRRILVENQD